ncbi:MAG: sigma-70 family RNA polymerase sigma factor [Pseudomonadota bacterium]
MTAPDGDLLSTTQLLERHRQGDAAARERLFGRFLPLLSRWARGRLPQFSRDLAETDDLVQVTLMRALNRIDDFEADRPGAFVAYLRTILLNLVRDELRRTARTPAMASLAESLPAPQASQLEQAVGRERLEQYERALARLPDDKRSAVIMRVEFDMSFEEIARELERPSANAARMMVARALDEMADAFPES